MTLADLIGRVWEEVKGAHMERCICKFRLPDPLCSALRSRLREALKALVKDWGFSCGSNHDLGKWCPGHLHERAAALKKLEE